MGSLARSTYLASSWLAVRVLEQTLWVVVLARTLGPGGYGLFAGITALAATLGTLTGLGFGVLMLQDASRQIGMLPAAWKKALVMSMASGVVLCILYVLVAPGMFAERVPRGVYAAIGISELICFPIVVVSSYAFQAHERMGWGGAMHALIPAGNLVALGLFLALSPSPDLSGYLPFHAAMAVLTTAGSLLAVKWLLSPGAARFNVSRRDIQEGAGFSAMRLADTAMNSLDKTLVLQLASSQAAGMYSAAYRLISVIILPLTSLSMSVLPRLFRTESGDERSTSLLIRSLALGVTAYGVFAGLATWAASGLLPVLLGRDFAPAASVVRWMAISPLLQGLYIIGANVLVTQRMLTLRILAQSLAIVVLLVSAGILVPSFGLPGAVLMLLVTQASAALLVWLCYLRARTSNSRRLQSKP